MSSSLIDELLIALASDGPSSELRRWNQPINQGRAGHSVSAVKSVRLIRFWNISVMTNS